MLYDLFCLSNLKLHLKLFVNVKHSLRDLFNYDLPRKNPSLILKRRQHPCCIQHILTNLVSRNILRDIKGRLLKLVIDPAFQTR